MITFDDFKKMDLRIVRIKEAKEHPNADKLLLLKFDLDGKEIQVVAGIKNFYNVDELVGKNVVALTNMETAKIRGEESAGMVLVARDDNSLSLLTPEKDVKNESKIS